MNCPRCETDVNEHEANRCLDAWVAEAVFDRKIREREPVPAGHDTWEYCLYEGDCPHGYGIGCHYSTSIAAAWEVVQKMRAEMTWHIDDHITGWNVALWHDKSADVVEAAAAFFPLAICRAALKAVYVGDDEK